MELLLGNGDRPVGLFFAAAGEPVQLPGVEERDPFCLVGYTPVEESEEGASGVVDAGVLKK